MKRWTLRSAGLWLVIGTLAGSHWWTSHQLRTTRQELGRLREQSGYLEIADAKQLAAIRIPDEDPLQWQFRVYVPPGKRCRLAYGTHWRSGKARPEWHSYVPVPEGESVITARIAADPRDGVWKISAAVRHGARESRSATTLPDEQTAVFRAPHDSISSGNVGVETVQTGCEQAFKLLEDQWLEAEGAWVLYGDRPPDTDVTGVFLELQPDP